MENNLELRMYSLVLYQLNGRQIGIQSGHSNVEYGVKYNFNEPFLDWARNWKTVIVLNGGSSITLTQHIEWLSEKGIENAPFIEPDLYNQVTSVSFLADERIFDYKKYPDFHQYILNLGCPKKMIEEYKSDELPTVFKSFYSDWVEMIGGEKNTEFLNWLRPFKLA